MQSADVGGSGSGSQIRSTDVGRMYAQTPLIESRILAKLAGCNVYLKLENTQPSGSFKLRGISNVVRKVRMTFIVLRPTAGEGGTHQL